MSDPHTDFLNKTAMLGQTQADLAVSRSNELGALMQSNRADRQVRAAKRELSEKQSELERARWEAWEWRASSDAFRLLSRQYGLELGKSQEQRILDRHEITLNLAEENEWIARTKFVAEANEALGKK